MRKCPPGQLFNAAKSKCDSPLMFDTRRCHPEGLGAKGKPSIEAGIRMVNLR
jgi:hypothetical protein